MLDEIDLLALAWDSLVEGLQQLSLPAEKQVQKLRGTYVADELADDFCSIAMPCARELIQHEWLSKGQYEALARIEEALQKMSKAQDKSIWEEKALYEAAAWEECRKMALKVLTEMQAEV